MQERNDLRFRNIDSGRLLKLKSDSFRSSKLDVESLKPHVVNVSSKKKLSFLERMIYGGVPLNSDVKVGSQRILVTCIIVNANV